MSDFERVRLQKRILGQYEILSILDARLDAVKRRRVVETDPSVIFKLQTDGQEISGQIHGVEQEVEQLKSRLAAATTDTKGAETTEPVGIPIFSAKLQYDVIPTGIYHLFDPVASPLVKYQVLNPSDHPVAIQVTTQILRYSDVARSTHVIESNSSLTFGHLPILVPLEIERLSAIKRATLHVRAAVLQHPEIVLKDDSCPVEMHACDTIPWLLQNVDSGEILSLSDYIAAWVTPNIKEVETVLRRAADRHPSHAIFGYQGGEGLTHEERKEVSRLQVKAMFQVLKEESVITYVSAPVTFGKKVGEAMQRVRLPRLSLEIGVANCIDGAVLIASLIETANMNPVIVLVPGHAYVGWETWPGTGKYDYLETTMVRDATFEQTLDAGTAEYQDAVASGLFRSGRARCIDIRQAHSSGILPME
jgi:hypothetical protein